MSKSLADKIEALGHALTAELAALLSVSRITETPRASYEDRRKQQIASGAQPIPAKPEKKYSLHVQFTECRGESFKDTENEPVQFRGKGSEKPTKFWSEEDPREAEAEHFKECGYHELVVHCPSCSLQASSTRLIAKIWHVRHRYSGDRDDARTGS